MVSILGLGILGSIAGIGATSVATGNASAAIDAAKQVAPHGLQIAYSHVPSWTHAYKVLQEHLSSYAQNGMVGGSGTAGVGTVLKKALGHAGKALLHH
ncbi:MAG: hypothetical protein JRN15_06575 [Nitrososphaerota archaeon]|nr:hypothetical protein [Nitrososphaerota archaeon]